MDKLPPALADVAGPLREAEDYARLQEVRQRGVYNLLTGLPTFLYVAPFWFPVVNPDFSHPWIVWVLATAWFALLLLACFPKTFLPLVRRLRPDWESPLLQSSILDRGMSKLFWWQMPFWVVYFLVTPILTILFAFDDLDRMPYRIHELRRLAIAIGLVTHVAAMLVMAWQSRRQGDRLMMGAFLVWAPAGFLVLLEGLGDQAPSALGAALFMIALVAPPVVVGLLRMISPRRWLLR